MAAFIVQSTFARGNTSPLTLTLGSAPTPGNTLLFVQAGRNISLTAPSGLTLLESDLGASSSTQATQAWYRTAQPGDGVAWAFTGASDYENLAVFEISGVTGAVGYPAHGAMSGSGTTTITTPALSAPVDPNALRLLVVEWDSAVSATTPAGWTLLSPAAWQSTASGTHDAAIYLIPTSTTGAQALTMSAAANNPIYADIAVETIPTAAQVAAAAREVLLTGNPRVSADVLAREVLHTGSGRVQTDVLLREALHSGSSRVATDVLLREVLLSGNSLSTGIRADVLIREVLVAGSAATLSRRAPAVCIIT